MVTWSTTTRNARSGYMDDFNSSDVADMLKNRVVVVIGDSNQRAIYKDLILLLQTNRYLTHKELKSKGELSFLNDELIDGGRLGDMCNGINYREVRQYKTDVHSVYFYFVTRCYNSYMETILADFQHPPIPDLVIMNSCLWDISRYGRESIPDYKNNLVKLFKHLKLCLPSNCLVIWNTTLPISSCARSGVLTPVVEVTTLGLDIMKANCYAQKLALEYNLDVLDLHFYLRHYLHMRAKDGIHWDMKAHRTISSLLLTHISEAWGILLPGRKITFGSYGSTHARNGYYQQLPSSRQQSSYYPQPSWQSVNSRQHNLYYPQPLRQLANSRQHNLYYPQPLQQQDCNRQHSLFHSQLPTNKRQRNSYKVRPFLQLQTNKREQESVNNRQQTSHYQQPLLQNPMTNNRQNKSYYPQSLLQQEQQPMQPLLYTDFTSDDSLPNTMLQPCLDSFHFDVSNVELQQVEVHDPFTWQPYQQSSSITAEYGQSNTRYQPYGHRRHEASGRHGYKPFN